jgi:hypothetical protein
VLILSDEAILSKGTLSLCVGKKFFILKHFGMRHYPSKSDVAFS